MKTKQQYYERQLQNRNLIDRLTGTRPLIYTTKELQAEYRHRTKPDIATVLKPSLRKQLVGGLNLLFPLCLLIYCLSLMLSETDHPIVYPAMLFIVATGWSGLQQTFIPGKYVFTMTLDKHGIRVNNEQIRWQDVHETLMQRKRVSRNLEYIFVVLAKDKRYEYCLNNISMHENEFAAIVEYYKKLGVNDSLPSTSNSVEKNISQIQ
ncbi:hypothetical protein [Flavobacterium sp.]|uniref:hypothetical protein n=1 Tax=Flavobacterium sp. TaxID=239 RepID=UPI0026198652|nr:hypothetical protein [Flavobacterium sp.]